eukprot:scaffold12492_cov36-Cyclotella_meneghiniana.AAC.1
MEKENQKEEYLNENPSHVAMFAGEEEDDNDGDTPVNRDRMIAKILIQKEQQLISVDQELTVMKDRLEKIEHNNQKKKKKHKKKTKSRKRKKGRAVADKAEMIYNWADEAKTMKNYVHSKLLTSKLFTKKNSYMTTRERHFQLSRDASFDHASIRACFTATNLIGPKKDEDSHLTARYIFEQVVFYPISLYKSQHFILRAYSFLEAFIFEDSTAMFELTYTNIELRDQTSNLCDMFWPERKHKLLDSIYHELSDSPGIPSRSDIMACDGLSQLGWNPVDTFQANLVGTL